MDFDAFIGREAEVRAILSNVAQGRSSLLIGEAGVGKSALLEVIEPLLCEEGKPVFISRISPFGTFLRELYAGLHAHGLTAETGPLEQAIKQWSKRFASNDERARDLVHIAGSGGVIIVIDDASGINNSSRPWLEALCEACILIAATDPAALQKHGMKRFWKRFDEVQLGRLSKAQAEELLESLIDRYRITADEPEVYRRRVLDLAQGSPFELARLVKYHSSEALVRARDISGQQFVEQDIQGVSIAPLLLVLGAFVVAARYIARAQGDMDLYVISGIGIGFLVIFGPLIRSTIRPRSL
ncbi:MAG: ATP-binding protein [Deinococcota bacterium]|nr:ATP-binding protein [Deinococcota bacterium]